ncbi:MAG: AzlC family ABC transporter permease [Thermoleophilaceae bacterium]
MEAEHSDLRAGVRAGLPLVVPTLAVGISFGVLAQPVMGSVAPIVMSVIVFAGSAQFAALSVLASGGGAAAAIVAGLLMNTRFLPMGFGVAPVLKGGPLRRAAEGQAVVDASFALGSLGEGRFDRGLLLGSVIPQAACWMGGTAIGAIGGSALSEPERFGIDAIFPAFFLALLVNEARGGREMGVAIAGGLVTLALLPFVPAGLAVIAAFSVTLIGLRRR